MSRSLSQIYNEAVVARNNYLQFTELQPQELSQSKLSIMNLITYISSVMIYAYETILDLFQIDIERLLTKRMNGTAEYYTHIAKKFQFNPYTQKGDELFFNEETLNVEYRESNQEHCIIDKAAYQYVDGQNEYDMLLKVCKSGVSGEGGSCEQLRDDELTAFKEYIDTVKFVGTKIRCISSPADILTIKAIIYYDDLYITGKDAYANVKAALIGYINELDYNQALYFQKIIDVIQASPNIKDVDAIASAQLLSCSVDTPQSRTVSTAITNRTLPFSGFVSFLDADGQSTLTVGYCDRRSSALLASSNLVFVPHSSLVK